MLSDIRALAEKDRFAVNTRDVGAGIGQSLLAVTAADGSRFELLCVHPTAEWDQMLHWLPALGVPARHYVSLAEALATRGIGVAIHEWRGIGSSTWRAGRRCNWGYRELLLDDLPSAMAALRARWSTATCWLGGHSLGGQLAALYAGLHPAEHAGLLLVASGSPYWRCYRNGWLLAAAYTAAPWLAQLVGYLPGRRIGFGGNEARGLIADWARSGRQGHYAADGMRQDFEQQLHALQLPVLGIRLRDDWMVPASSLAWLLGKMPQATQQVETITSQHLDGRDADHFGWMKAPLPVASRIAHWLHQQN